MQGEYTDDEIRKEEERRKSARSILEEELSGGAPTSRALSGGENENRNTPAPSGNSGGSSRDDALRRVQEAYSNAGVAMGETDAANLMGKNPEDVGQFANDLIAQASRRAGNTPGSGSSSASAPVYTGNSGSSGGSSSGSNGVSELLSYLQQQQTRQDAERASMRQILMSQLGDATKPVDVNDPTLQRIIDPQKLALQRSAERQRSQLAARLNHPDMGLGDSGTFDTGLRSIEENRGESEAGIIGNVLSSELSQRRNQVLQLLQLAVASGDSESARTLQAQLNTLNSQLQNEQFGRSLDQQGSQFGQTLGFNYDQLGTNSALATAGLNQNAILALLGAL